jgi:Histidine kinase-, DNA gyrase B-, and HSP90-like ATPase
LPTVPLQANNRIWLTYQHFPYKAWNAVAELVDNSVQSYTDNKTALNKQLRKDKDPLFVRITSSDELFSIWDNAMGMNLEDLNRAVQLAAPPPNTSGRSEFGMGMKTSCCWLGGIWTIITKKLGNDTEYSVTIDVNEIAASDSHELLVTEKKAGKEEHYTRIDITHLYPRLRTRAQGKTKSNLVELFRTDIEKSVMDLYWNGDRLQPPPIVPLVTDENGKKTTWKKNISFQVDGLAVDGWICILGEGQRGREHAGFDLFRRGRVIIGRPLGYRPNTIFGEARNDLLNQRLYGQLNLNNFPVNHLKDDFLWDGREEDFQQKLRDKAVDYIDYARRYRPTKSKGIALSTAVVVSTNDEMAEELTEEEMAEQLEVVEIMEVPDDPDPAVVEAKATRLRAQKIEPRIVEVGQRTFRIYHPEDMPDNDPYFFRQSAEDNVIDIFINDNHPFVAAKATDESSYVMFVRMCIMDAIVEHQLLHREAKGFTATFPTRLKDVLLRGIKV